MSTDSRPTTHPEFLSIEHAGGGFMEGTLLPFAPGYTAILGESGTGKTTMLESLRYAVRPGPAASAEANKILTATLGGGALVRVKYKNEFGVVYTIERPFGQPARVFDPTGREVSVSVDEIVRVSFCSTEEIHELAKSHAKQLELIDNLAGDEMRELAREISGVERSLRDNAGKIVELARAAADLGEEAHEAGALEERLRAMLPAASPEATELRAAAAAKGLREREAHAFVAADAELARAQHQLGSVAAEIGRQLGAIVDEELLTSPNATSTQALARRVAEVAAAFETSTAELRALCAKAQADLAREAKTLANAHLAQEQAYGKLLATSAEEAQRAKDREVLQKRLARARDARKGVDLRQRERSVLDAERRALLTRLSGLRAARFEIRKRVARELEEQLVGIEVSVSQAGSDELFRKALTDAGVHPATATTLAKDFLPTELAAIVLRDDLARLEQILSSQTARKVFARLQESAVFEVEIAELADVPCIKLRHGTEMKQVDDVSRGQKGSALLPILLLLGNHPVVIDQPEDHLYARFKSTTIVSLLKELKKRRQIIFATHDQNLVILPVADRVNVLASSGARGTLHASGTMVDSREMLEDLLEGGRAAFDARLDFYRGPRDDGDK